MKTSEEIFSYLKEGLKKEDGDLSFIVEMAESVQDNSGRMDSSKARVRISAFRNLLAIYYYSKVIADCFPEFHSRGIYDDIFEKRITEYEEFLVKSLVRNG